VSNWLPAQALWLISHDHDLPRDVRPLSLRPIAVVIDLDRVPRAVAMRVLEDRREVYSAIKVERVDCAILSDNSRAPNP
jgi:hypothetical protein